MPLPAVRVLSENPVPLPINNCPLEAVAAFKPVPPLATGTVPEVMLEPFKPVKALPLSIGRLPLPSNCTILFAVVPTSTFNVTAPELPPPVNPVPAVMLVIVPPPAAIVAGAQLVPLNCNT